MQLDSFAADQGGEEGNKREGERRKGSRRERRREEMCKYTKGKSGYITW